jgi:DNA-binding FrmR family transcriptional regulator
MADYPDHAENLLALRRIEGQIRGIQKMIERRDYCVDILNQIHAVIYALARVEDRILGKHFEGCVTNAVKGRSLSDKKKKLEEILQLIHKFRKV